MKKALVLYSGGLDSRLVVRILQEQDFDVTAIYFKLPFGCSCNSANLTETLNCKIEIKDVTKNPLLEEYLEILKSPQFGTGTGINPCKDCKVFMFKKAKEFADKNGFDLIATGEVLGQRPMSQLSSSIKTINEAIGFEILRPLSALRLPETSFEKSGIVDRNKLYEMHGRGRKEQMALAEKFQIKYPTPGGGCYLCERQVAGRLDKLIRENLVTEKSLPLTMIGRHFFIDGVWFVVARSEMESMIINNFENCIQDEKNSPSVYYSNESGKQKAKELQDAYSTGKEKGDRDKFSAWKI